MSLGKPDMVTMGAVGVRKVRGDVKRRMREEKKGGAGVLLWVRGEG
jgi:hypothetical protein